MIRTLLHLLVGLILSGCTINNFHNTESSFDQQNSELVINSGPIQEREEPSIQTEEKRITITGGNIKLHANCEIYTPLPVPKPIKIDLKELESAESGKEINVITLRNVKAIHLQMTAYAARQQKHYNDYIRRCVIK